VHERTIDVFEDAKFSGNMTAYSSEAKKKGSLAVITGGGVGDIGTATVGVRCYITSRVLGEFEFTFHGKKTFKSVVEEGDYLSLELDDEGLDSLIHLLESSRYIVHRELHPLSAQERLAEEVKAEIKAEEDRSKKKISRVTVEHEPKATASSLKAKIAEMERMQKERLGE
jgi:hypothetical protein